MVEILVTGTGSTFRIKRDPAQLLDSAVNSKFIWLRSEGQAQLMVNVLLLILVSTTIFSSACETNRALTPKSPDTSASNIAQVRSAAFAGANQAWLVDERHDKLWRTADGGKSWDTVSGKAIGGQFWAATFIDSQSGWAANYEGQIWRTYDGCTTWTLISQPTGGQNP